MMARMSEIIRELGLATLSPADQLSRSIGVERREAVGLPPARPHRHVDSVLDAIRVHAEL
jgi:hypothetical protein